MTVQVICKTCGGWGSITIADPRDHSGCSDDIKNCIDCDATGFVPATQEAIDALQDRIDALEDQCARLRALLRKEAA